MNTTTLPVGSLLYPQVVEVPASRGPVFKALDAILDRVLSGKVTSSNASQAIRRLIHSDFVYAAVKLSPTPTDDVILELLRALVPPPDAPAK